jgi:hypothetical protein
MSERKRERERCWWCGYEAPFGLAMVFHILRWHWREWRETPHR